MLAEFALIVTTIGGAGMSVYAQFLFRKLHTDQLTGLANRAALTRYHRATVKNCPVSVLMADLNGFKTVNDTYGHRFGDRVLTVVARRLTDIARPSELVVRLHGDEFAVLINHGYTCVSAYQRAREFAQVIDELVQVDGKPIDIGLSIGVAAGHATTDALPALMARADERMYRTKFTTKNSRIPHTNTRLHEVAA